MSLTDGFIATSPFLAICSVLQSRMIKLDFIYISCVSDDTFSLLQKFLNHKTSNMTSPQNTRNTAMYDCKRAQEWILFLAKLRKAKIEIDSYGTFLCDWEMNGSRSHSLNDEPLDEGWGYDAQQARNLVGRIRHEIESAQMILGIADLAEEEWDRTTRSPLSPLSMSEGKARRPSFDQGDDESPLPLRTTYQRRHLVDVGSPWGHLIAACSRTENLGQPFEELWMMIMQ